MRAGDVLLERFGEQLATHHDAVVAADAGVEGAGDQRFGAQADRFGVRAVDLEHGAGFVARALPVRRRGVVDRGARGL